MLSIFLIFISIFKIEAEKSRISIIEQSLHTSAEEIPIKVNWLENGLYAYKTAKPIDIEVHAIFVNYKNLFIHDVNDRLHRYYFKNWEDEDKNKFVIDEHYEDDTYGFFKEKEWILVYETYIEASTYEEIIEATDVIIKYSNYIGNQVYIGSNIYIKYKGEIIRPIQSSNTKEDTIKTNVWREYNEVTNKLGD